MNRRSLLAAAVGIGLALTATGCGASQPADDQTSHDQTSNDQTSDDQTSVTPDSAEITIKRDEYGVPHIYADTTYDLYFGYGYVVAEDRLFQMEMSKRSVLGTAAEVVGAEALDNDRISRSNYDPRSIQAQIDALPQEEHDVLKGYADGVNRRIDEVMEDKDNLLPKQFTDFDFVPQHWSPYDVAMIWVGTMASRFSDSTPELKNLQLRTQLISELGEEQGSLMFDQLVWVEDPTAVTTVPRTDDKLAIIPGNMPYDGQQNSEDSADAPSDDSGSQASSDHLSLLQPAARDLVDRDIQRMEQFAGEGSSSIAPEASNLWVVGPDKTHDGETIFLNGPQFGNFNPSYVYAVGLHGAGFDVVGNSPFAYPVVLFGTNSHITWGSTAGPLDVNDVYQVELNPDDRTQYRFEGEWRTMESRDEVIAVKGENDVVQTTYYTVHGAVTSFDEENGVAYAKKRSWDGIEIQTLLAWVKSTKATNWDEFLQSASLMGITNNWYYADNDGNIGYVSVGRLPDRPDSQDRRVPALGDGSMEWNGFRPFDDNPKVFNPAQGYIANWNNQSAAGFSSHNTWGPVHRLNEITSRLQSQEKFTPEEIWAVNEETSLAELNVRYLRPYLLEAVEAQPADEALQPYVDLLAEWNGQQRDDDRNGFYDGPQPMIMETWLPLLTEEVLAGKLPESVYGQFARFDAPLHPVPALQLIYNAFLGEDAGVKQNIDFLEGRDPLQITLETYKAAIQKLVDEYGEDTSSWAKKPVNTHNFNHRNFMGVIQAAANEDLQGPIAMNRGTQNHMVVLGEGRAEMCSVAPPGQSGFISPDGVESEHYKDQLELYINFECKVDHLTPAEVDSNTKTTKVLAP